MDFDGKFHRLIRLVQETGERLVVSFEPQKEPIVLLPLSVYEQLMERQGQSSVMLDRSSGVEGGKQAVQPPRRREPEEIGEHVRNGLKPLRTDAFRMNALESGVHDNAAVDSWDGEAAGEEYDAERIFAQIDREKNKGPVFTQAPDRLRASVARAGEAYGNGKLPPRGGSLENEERFSLGMG